MLYELPHGVRIAVPARRRHGAEGLGLGDAATLARVAARSAADRGGRIAHWPRKRNSLVRRHERTADDRTTGGRGDDRGRQGSLLPVVRAHREAARRDEDAPLLRRRGYA